MSEIIRCKWCQSHPLLQEYHDAEWGLPIFSQKHLYEHIVLEIFQAGLNWLTMLKKREGFRLAFADFAAEKVAKYGAAEMEKLMTDASLIRNRRKIEASVNNARIFLDISEKYHDFGNFISRFKPEKEIIYQVEADIPAQTAEAAALAKELKEWGFKFIGPTSAYAYMQGVGLVNDHIESCFRFAVVEGERRRTLKAKFEI